MARPFRLTVRVEGPTGTFVEIHNAEVPKDAESYTLDIDGLGLPIEVNGRLIGVVISGKYYTLSNAPEGCPHRCGNRQCSNPDHWTTAAFM